MKNLTIIILVLFISCSTRDDYFESNNTAPILEILNESNIIYDKYINDSIKINNSFDAYYSILNENINDNNLKLNISNNLDSVSILKNQFKIFPKKTGTIFYEIYTKDTYNSKSNSYNITLEVFDNLAPVIIAEVRKVENGLLNNEIEIDLSKSFDADKKFGGKIVLYEYKIQDNYYITSPLSKIRYIFESSGQKHIQLRVQDCDHAWSNYENIYITL